MQRVTRVIRKVEPRSGIAFDDRLWPVNVALCVLASFIIGVVLAYLRFDDVRWYANAWTWLPVVVAISGTMLAAFRYLDPKKVRRVLQLALVLGLLLHCVMVVVLLETDIFGRVAEMDRPAKQLSKVPRRVAPQDPVFQLNREQQQHQDFRQPVATPTVTQQAMQVDRQQQAQSASSVAQPHQVPNEQQTTQPHSLQRAKPASTAPHKSDEAGKLSRRRSDRLPNPKTPVARLETGSRSPQQAPPMAPQRNLVQRQRTERSPNSRATPQPKDTSRARSVRSQRATETPRTVETPQPRTLPRRRVATLNPTRSSIPSNRDPSRAQQTNSQALQAQRVQQTRQQDLRSQVTRSTNEPNPDNVRTTNAMQRRSSPAPRQQDFARTDTPTPRTRSRSRRSPSTQERPNRLIVQNQSSPSPRIGTQTNQTAQGQLTPRASQVRRQTETSPMTRRPDPTATASTTMRTDATRARAANTSQASAVSNMQRSRSTTRQLVTNNDRVVNTRPTPSRSPNARQAQAMSVNRAAPQSAQTTAKATARRETTPANASTTQRTASARAAMSPTGQQTNSTAQMPRASRRSRVATSVEASSPNESQVQATRSRQITPARTSFDRSTQGLAGVGASRNLDRAASAEQSPARVASGSARRVQATQSSPAGEAFTPSQPAQVARNRAGRQRPMTTRRAQATNNRLAGSDRVDPLNASASAALERRSANATAATTTGAAGDIEIDLGPTRRVSGQGAGRASGGGAQVPNLTHSRSRARRRPSGISANTLRSAVRSPLTQSPGSGNPRNSAQLQARSTNVGQTSVGRQRTAQRNRAQNESRGGTSQSAAASGQVARSQGPAQPSPSDVLNTAQPATARSRGSRPQPGTSQVAQAAPQAGGTAKGGSLAARSATVGRQQLASGSAQRPADLRSPNQSPGASQPGAIRRAAAGQGVPAASEPGGGTASPRRRLASAAVRSNTRANTVVVPGGPQSVGASRPRVGTTGPRATNLAGGARSVAGQGPVGNRTNNTTPGDAASNQVAVVGKTGPRASGQGSSATEPGSPSRGVSRSRRAIGPQLTKVEVDSPSDVLGTPTGRPNSILPGQGLQLGATKQQTTGARSISVEAPAGTGGVGDVASVDPGVRSRRARVDSQEISNRNERFVRKRSAGPLKINVTTSVPREAFQQRTARVQGRPKPGPGAGPQTEKAIELGLVFLARNQEDDGRWKLSGFPHQVSVNSDSAATGLALLSFQGAGYHHKDFKYAKVVNDGLQFLVKNQQPNGSLYVNADKYSNRYVKFYSHSIAALALCEAYGMTQDEKLREPAQKSLDYLVKTQSSRGGWRYQEGGVSSDTSVTGWVYVALKSGQLAGLRVPKKTYDGINRWLDESQASPRQRHLYRYNPYAKDSDQFQRSHQTKPSPTMTSVGLLLRLYSGWKPGNVAMKKGALYLNTNLPSRLPRDTYYWYYATQVMYHVGGKEWEKWYGDLYPLLIKSQVQTGQMAGSWDPIRPVPDRWASAGRLYVTTMNLLSLEVHYRHLPLYK